METFLGFLKETVLMILVVLIAPTIAAGFIEGYYLFQKSFNVSSGTVSCDGTSVYTGKLYRVGQTLETKNLQAPMFSVRIKGERNFFKTEAFYFCKDYRIMKK